MEDKIALGIAIIVGFVILANIVFFATYPTSQERIKEAGKECYHIGYRIEVERVATLQCVERGYRQ